VGKAHQAPDATYQRQFVISAHALERFRQRAEIEHQARSDFDLGNLLDERIRFAESTQTIIDTRAVESTTRVFEMVSRDGHKSYAVVRDMTVITVLEEWQMKANFDNGSWKPGPMNAPFSPSKLRGVVAAKSIAPSVELRRGPPPGVPGLPTVVHVADIAPLKPVPTIANPVADAGIKLGNAMVAHAQAQHDVMSLEAQLAALHEEINNARMRVDAAADAVRDAQVALGDAVEAQTNQGKTK
jgi:hypothetical protein